MSRADTQSLDLRAAAVRDAKRLVVKVGAAVLSKGNVGLHRPTLERI